MLVSNAFDFVCAWEWSQEQRPSARVGEARDHRMTGTTTKGAVGRITSSAPARAELVLVALILVAAVANLNLAVANVALPSIGQAFDASQTELDLIAVGYSLGLAASVLYFGAIGDRYGRKLLLIVGTALAIPASCLAACGPSVFMLYGSRAIR